MAQGPLKVGVLRLLEAARNEEWTLDRALGDEREGPLLDYARWHHGRRREVKAIGVLSRWYEAVRGAALPTKALSDASYDLAGGLARAGRLDDAMHYLPDAFSYNDKAAVPVLKAWARTDQTLAGLADRADFRTLVGA